MLQDKGEVFCRCIGMACFCQVKNQGRYLGVHEPQLSKYGLRNTGVRTSIPNQAFLRPDLHTRS